VAAEDSALAANAAANFKGNWASLTGVLAKPAAVWHSSTIWALLNDLADVTTSQPGVSGDWVEIGGVKRTGDTMTGHLEVPAGASGNQAPRASETVLKAGSTQVMSVDLTVPSLNGGQLAGQRRKNLNGAMTIAQRGTSFACPANTEIKTLDGWTWLASGATVATVTQSTDVPAGSDFQYSQRVTINTADTSIAAGDRALLFTTVEGYDARDLIGKPITATFDMRSAKTGAHGVAFQNAAGDRSYITTVVVNAANAWEKKTVQIPAGLITSGTWNWANGAGLYVWFTLAAGTTFRSTAGSWLTGDYYTTSAQVNVCDTVNNIFAVTGVQIARGTVDTPYEHMPFQKELTWAQRYVRPNGCLVGVSISTTLIQGIGVDFTGAPMRAAPTVLLKNGTGTAHDVAVAFRNISAPIFTGDGLGGYVAVTSTTTTNNKVHNILSGALLFDASL
jgi:hypothetical protein